MTFSKILWVVTARVEPAVEHEWNDWYSNVHLPEISACPGFVQHARFVGEAPAGRRYLTLYEIDTAEAVASPQFNARRGWGPFGAHTEAEARLFRRTGS